MERFIRFPLLTKETRGQNNNFIEFLRLGEEEWKKKYSYDEIDDIQNLQKKIETRKI